MDLDDGRQVRYLIRDRDGKYQSMFDHVLVDVDVDVDADITIVLSGVRMPRMNSIVERWVQSCRPPASPGHRECPTPAAAARTGHRSRDTHASAHPPPRPPRRPPPRIRSCCLTCADAISGTRRALASLKFCRNTHRVNRDPEM